jgi:hypothetical protein
VKEAQLVKLAQLVQLEKDLLFSPQLMIQMTLPQFHHNLPI